MLVLAFFPDDPESRDDALGEGLKIEPCGWSLLFFPFLVVGVVKGCQLQVAVLYCYRVIGHISL